MVSGLVSHAEDANDHNLPLMAWYSFRDTPISPGLFYEALRFPILACGVMTGSLVVIRHLVGDPGAVWELAYSAFLAPMLYCGVWMLLPGGKEKLAHYYSHGRSVAAEMISKFSPPATSMVSGM